MIKFARRMPGYKKFRKYNKEMKKLIYYVFLSGVYVSYMDITL